jgi:predicted O-methyltransferase YrrM
MEKLDLNQSDKKRLIKFEHQRQTNRRLWNIDKETAHLLYFWVKSYKPKHILEIGTSNGYSTFWLAKAASYHDGIVETIEVDKNRYKMAQENLQGVVNIKMHFGLAEKIIPSLPNLYNFVFIDAGKIGYVDYLKLMLDKLDKDAVIIADNVISHSHSIQDYLQLIRKSDLFETMTLSIGAGLEISIKK